MHVTTVGGCSEYRKYVEEPGCVPIRDWYFEFTVVVTKCQPKFDAANSVVEADLSPTENCTRSTRKLRRGLLEEVGVGYGRGSPMLTQRT